MITRSNMSALMAPYMRKIMLDRYKQIAKQYTILFNIATSTKQLETMLGITGFGLVPERPEGEGVRYDDPIQGFSAKFIHLTYALGYQITSEAVADDQYKMLGKKMAEQLGKSAAVTKEILAASILNNGFTTANGPDALPLFSTSHPLTGGGVYGNRPGVAAALSATSLQAALLVFRRQQDDRGKQLMIKPKYLVVPPELEYTAYAILNSTLMPGTNNNDVNSLKGALEIVVMDYLTSPTAWYIAGEKEDHGLIWYDRQDLKMDDTTDFDTGNAKYKAEWRSSCGFSDWRGLWGTTGA